MLIMRNYTFLLFFVLLLSFVLSAPAISDYAVPTSVPLGGMISATGIYSNDGGNVNAVLCSFYFFDSLGVLVPKRATDQYTTGSGRFSLVNFTPQEPFFKRGQTYSLLTDCNGAVADQNFLIAQRETIADPASKEFEYITNPENVDTVFIWAILVLVIVFIGLGIIFLFKVVLRGKR